MPQITGLPSKDVDLTVRNGPPHLSIVSTMYLSRTFLPDFLTGCVQAAADLGVDDYEIVLVNDGSQDDSLEYALLRREDLPSLVVVDLSRNFGHHHAMHAGLRVARGELVFLIDCDLEVSPSVLTKFYLHRRKTEADVVFGYQESRKGGWFERWSGGVFWKGFNLLSDTRIPENVLTERIMTRQFLDALLSLGDHNVFLAGMMSWTGFNQIGIVVHKSQRQGQTTYTFMKRVALMVNAVSSFSSKPLTWLFNMGALITAISFSYATYLVLRKIIFGDTLVGFTSIMAMLALSLGISTMAMGLVGIYLGKIFNQVQGRPTYIVKGIHRSPGSRHHSLRK